MHSQRSASSHSVLPFLSDLHCTRFPQCISVSVHEAVSGSVASSVFAAAALIRSPDAPWDAPSLRRRAIATWWRLRFRSPTRHACGCPSPFILVRLSSQVKSSMLLPGLALPLPCHRFMSVFVSICVFVCHFTPLALLAPLTDCLCQRCSSRTSS